MQRSTEQNLNKLRQDALATRRTADAEFSKEGKKCPSSEQGTDPSMQMIVAEKGGKGKQQARTAFQI